VFKGEKRTSSLFERIDGAMWSDKRLNMENSLKTADKHSSLQERLMQPRLMRIWPLHEV
jgi:hypothetical protein